MDAIIKQDFMAKRSQMKGTFKKEDYKSRWFRLTANQLYYLDGSIEMGAGKIKGSIPLSNIIIIEQVDSEPLQNRTNAFQVVYTEMNKDRQEQRCTLYIIAVHEQQMLDWIEALREGIVRFAACFEQTSVTVCYDKG